MNLAVIGIVLGAAWLFSSRKKKKLKTPTMPESEDGGLTPPPMFRDALPPDVYEIPVGERAVLEFPNAASDWTYQQDGQVGFEIDHPGALPSRTWFFTFDPESTAPGASVQLTFVDGEGRIVAVYTLGAVS